MFSYRKAVRHTGYIVGDDPGSTGIGLSISHRIIRDHRGTLKIKESKWGGAEFRIELPVEKRMDPR